MMLPAGCVPVGNVTTLALLSAVHSSRSRSYVRLLFIWLHDDHVSESATFPSAGRWMWRIRKKDGNVKHAVSFCFHPFREKFQHC